MSYYSVAINCKLPQFRLSFLAQVIASYSLVGRNEIIALN